MPHLLRIALGPVQPFIASARRTGDLCSGSQIVNLLAKTAARTICELSDELPEKNQLIMPYVGKDWKNVLAASSELAISNKILAYIHTPPDKTGEAIQKALYKELFGLVDRLLNTIKKDSEHVKSQIHKIDSEHAKNQTHKIDKLEHDIEALLAEAVDWPSSKDAPRVTIKGQLANLLEFYWVAVPFDEKTQQPANYAEQSLLLEKLLTARKNTHDFRQATGGNTQPKSSIDGQLESVIPDKLYATYAEKIASKPETAHIKNSLLYTLFRAGPSERLSGIDLLKRRGFYPDEDEDQSQQKADQSQPAEKKPQPKFLSTSHVAALPFLFHCNQIYYATDQDNTIGNEKREQQEELRKKQAELREKWDQYINAIKVAVKQEHAQIGVLAAPDRILERVPEAALTQYEIPTGASNEPPKTTNKHPITGDYDGGMLFIERLQEHFATPKALDEPRKKLQEFFNSVQKFAGQPLQPSPYYAIIQADGDSMFELTKQQASGTNGMERHKQLSQALANFSADAQKIVKKHKGSMIYAGGDDVLAFLPLHTALYCAQELAASFAEHMQGFQHDKEKKASLSVGIAIVHHLSLLLSARDIAKKAVDTAKEQPNKHGLSIIIQKRSGEQYQIADNLDKLAGYLTELIPYCMPPAPGAESASERLTLPKGTAYEIRAMALKTLPRKDQLAHLQKDQAGRNKISQLKEVVARDTLRILQRKLMFSIADLPRKEREAASEVLLAKFRLRLTATSSEKFIDELIIAQELAETLEQAGMSRAETIAPMTAASDSMTEEKEKR